MIGLEAHLKTIIIPFWKNLKDMENGGFFGKVDYQLKTHKNSDKTLISISRYLYAFSLWYGYFKEDDLLEDASHAYQFLIEHLRDEIHGGYYWQVTYDGLPSDVTKHVYGHAFAIYALSEYAKITDNKKSLEEALSIFELIEQKAHLGEFSYHEEFTNKWLMKDNELLSEHGANLPYTTNTLLHLLEAYTNLYRASKNTVVKARLIELINGFTKTLYDDKEILFHMYLDHNKQVRRVGQSFGHDIETCWLIDDACLAIDYHRSDIEQMTKNVAEKVYERAFTKNGLYSESIHGRICKDRIWWIQAEALVGFYNHYQKYKDNRYAQATISIYEFIKTYIVDDRPNSEWLWGVDENLEPLKYRGIAEGWKAAYHNGRAIIELLKRGLS
ncbi:AGE family epimerase/isomerase [Peloplasma aerotolerans]|uniref:AGE family epimerase/isomerase n=1 Tax=Peloplasma aerotolerans TaxID=3044389 RepID=A0AAW6U8G4_9MOLU|nr:AGE family epimerase/isomerase [Mariniplasma sp. M4Ah]MDI6452757.1 AGE family epimerase/isomerase [Mariniplasma sp. M4Ah]MDR4967980.1 AGE family epimerase/isomerase [Acholeplasmataceae bacterium]